MFGGNEDRKTRVNICKQKKQGEGYKLKLGIFEQTYHCKYLHT